MDELRKSWGFEILFINFWHRTFFFYEIGGVWTPTDYVLKKSYSTDQNQNTHETKKKKKQKNKWNLYILYRWWEHIRYKPTSPYMETSIWAIRSTSKGRAVERWERGFAKVWLLNPRTGSDCKIAQSPISIGCWSDGPDWSFHNLHGDVGLHLIRSHRWYPLTISLFMQGVHIFPR